jgi:hypothetical protein
MSVQLLVLEGKHVGRRVKLPLTQFVIGRDPRCHLRPASSDVSRFHCAIASTGPSVQVRDLKSRNGTFVNGERVAGTVRIANGDVLSVGPLRFELQVDANSPLMRSGDSELGWLVRSPDDEERKALDPSAGTLVLMASSLETVRDGTLTRPWSPVAEGDKAGAVAGDFLREYLARRSLPRETADRPRLQLGSHFQATRQ